MQYEVQSLQEKARQVIPVVRLETQAKQKFEQLQASNAGADIGYKDLLLLELLAWFKDSFFHWVDAPLCDHCSSATESVGSAVPNEEEHRNGATRVESYKCSTCLQYTRFPRYNNPGRLLETRRGRCGEWANCFTLCCIAMGLETRHVLDWTDHVWSEVWSDSQQRWLHVDPCEKACDKPLMYESGWGKKLTYVIAFSKDDIQDVTWRYSAKHQEVLSRRQECSELWLVQTVLRLRKDKQANLPLARKQALQTRLVRELVDFLAEKTAGEGESGIGRQSGSLAWRTARGEMGQAAAAAVTITPEPAEITASSIQLQYNCSTDTYHRPAANISVKGWQSLVCEAKNVFRKEEKDWKMCYLARTEGSDSASVLWKFDLSGMILSL